MCGRFFLNITPEELENKYGIKNIPQEIKLNRKEIFPSDDSLVVYENNKKVGLMNWGFRPSYSNNLVINARSETVHKKKLFKESFHTRRCLILANGFYEWKKEASKKEKYYITSQNDNLISLAGIYDSFSIDGKQKLAFCILTKDAPQKLINIHDRIPVIIKKEDEKEWLKNSFTPEIFDYLGPEGLEFEIDKL